MLSSSPDDLKIVARTASFNGLLFLYALCISNKKKRAFNLKEFTESSFKGNVEKTYSYFHGFMVAINSVRLVKVDFFRDVITVSEFPSFFEEIIVKELADKIKRQPAESVAKTLFTNRLKLTENFFDNK